MKPQPHEEIVARLDDAELVALGVGEHHMGRVRSLAHVGVLRAEVECPGHGLLLVLQGGAGQVEVQPVLGDLLRLGGTEAEAVAGVVPGHQGDAVVGIVGSLQAQDSGPEMR